MFLYFPYCISYITDTVCGNNNKTADERAKGHYGIVEEKSQTGAISLSMHEPADA
jgi:hypothetical protein